MANRTGKVGRPFPKGVSGNPSGRPKSAPLSAELRKILAEKAEGGQWTNAHMVAWAMVQLAKSGKVEAARLVWEYTEGKPTQPVTFDLEREAERLAAEHGVDKGRLLDITRRIAAQAG